MTTKLAFDQIGGMVVSVRDYEGLVVGSDWTAAIAAADLAAAGGSLFFDDQVHAVEGVLTLSSRIVAPPKQIFNISGTGAVQLQGVASDQVSSLWFAADPWDSFVECCEQLAAHRGGTVKVEPAVYDADKPCLISSEYPVNLIGQMWTSQQTALEVLTPENYITPKAGLSPTDAIIEYSGDGGGRVKGLLFVDDGDIENASFEARRVTEFGAALRLTEYNLSRSSDLYFLFLKASAIETGSCTMSTIKDVWVRRCGKAGYPSINIKNTGSGFSAQSFELSSVRSEVNYGAPYIELGTESTKCKLMNIGFETDVSEVATAQTFIKNDGGENNGTLIHLNRNTALKLEDTGSDSQWDNIRASTGGDNGVIKSTGSNFTLVNYTGKNNTAATDEILYEGSDATFQGVLNTGGGIRCTGNNANIDVNIVGIQAATNAAVEVNQKSKVTLEFRDPVAAVDAVLLAGNTNRVHDSHIEDIPSGKAGINTGAVSQNIISNNQVVAPTGATGIDTSSGSTNNVIGNNVQGAGTAYNLSGSDTSTANT
jgi:hypothetical protein